MTIYRPANAFRSSAYIAIFAAILLHSGAAAANSVYYSEKTSSELPKSTQSRLDLQQKVQDYLTRRWTPARIKDFCQPQTRFLGVSILPQDNPIVQDVYVGLDGDDQTQAKEESDRCFREATSKSFENRFRQVLAPSPDALGGKLHEECRELGKVTWFANVSENHQTDEYRVMAEKGEKRWTLEIAPLDFANWTDDDFIMHRIECSLLNTLDAYVFSRDRACIFWIDRTACLVQRKHARLKRKSGKVTAYECDLPNGQILKVKLNDDLTIKWIARGGPIDQFWNDDLLKNFADNRRSALRFPEIVIDTENATCKRIELWQDAQPDTVPADADRDSKYYRPAQAAERYKTTTVAKNQTRSKAVEALMQSIESRSFRGSSYRAQKLCRSCLVLYSSERCQHDDHARVARLINDTIPTTSAAVVHYVGSLQDPPRTDPEAAERSKQFIERSKIKALAHVMRIIPLAPECLGMRDVDFDSWLAQLEEAMRAPQ